MQMRVVQGLYVLKLAAQYALLDDVPLRISNNDLLGYNSYATLTAKQADIEHALMLGIQVMAVCMPLVSSFFDACALLHDRR